MAFVDRIWFHGSNKKNDTMRVTVMLKPDGEVAIDVPIPANFHAAVLEMAQLAADLHESQMRAEIIADNHIEEIS